MGKALARTLRRCAGQFVHQNQRNFGTHAGLAGRAGIVPAAAQLANAIQRASLVMPASQEMDDLPEHSAGGHHRGSPQVVFDHYGAISMVTEEPDDKELAWENEDGKRHEDGRYAAFASEISAFIPGACLAPPSYHLDLTVYICIFTVTKFRINLPTSLWRATSKALVACLVFGKFSSISKYHEQAISSRPVVRRGQSISLS